MSQQDEPTPAGPDNSPETQDPAVSVVQRRMVGQIKIGQSAAVQNGVSGAVVAGRDAVVSNSVSGAVVAGGSVELANSLSGVTVVGGKAHIANSNSGLLFSKAATIEHSTVGVLFAPETALGQDVKVIMTTRQALLFGVAFGMVAVIFGGLFRRRRGRRG
jgi:hypothetical protein